MIFKKRSLSAKKSWLGFYFILPFIFGFLFFFLYPFIQSIVFSMSRLVINPDGYSLAFVRWENYRKALLVHPDFLRVFLTTISNILADVPLIIFFSIFAALLLNQRFKGRLLVRTIFFLPVIMGAGIILALERTDFMTELLQTGQDLPGGFLSGSSLKAFLLQLKLPELGLKYILNIVDKVPIIIRASGIQILIFLAGLKAIPSSLYEASKVEGATGWEDFWFITLPLISPLIVTNIVYTVIDSFTAGSNDLVKLIRDTAFGGAGYGVSTAMANLYFFTIALLLAITVAISARWVFYQED